MHFPNRWDQVALFPVEVRDAHASSKSKTRAQPRDPHEVLTWVQGRVLYQLDIRCDLQVFGELQPVVRLDGILVARVRAEQLLIRPAPVLTES